MGYVGLCCFDDKKSVGSATCVAMFKNRDVHISHTHIYIYMYIDRYVDLDTHTRLCIPDTF